MTAEVKRKSYSFAEENILEIARYSGARELNAELENLIKNCIEEAEREKAVDYRVCYLETPIDIVGKKVQTPFAIFESEGLAKTLCKSSSAIIFACTLGIGIDRLIKKYSETNPSKALVFQALGAERTETFTDLFLQDISKEKGVKLSSRFSPGYGDLPLSAQRDIFAVLNPLKLIGLTLNDSLLMSPSKSVTAIVGIGGDRQNKCENCKSDCIYKK